MVFGALYYQGFAKKDKHGHSKGESSPTKAPPDEEVGPDGEKAPLLVKGEDKP